MNSVPRKSAGRKPATVPARPKKPATTPDVSALEIREAEAWASYNLSRALARRRLRQSAASWLEGWRGSLTALATELARVQADANREGALLAEVFDAQKLTCLRNLIEVAEGCANGLQLCGGGGLDLPDLVSEARELQLELAEDLIHAVVTEPEAKRAKKGGA